MYGVFVWTATPNTLAPRLSSPKRLSINTQQGVGHMGTEITRYAIGDFGQLHKFTGKDAPAGTVALVEEDGKSLTAKGKTYTARFSEILPNVYLKKCWVSQISVKLVTN